MPRPRRIETGLPPGIRRTPFGYQSYRWVTDASKPRGGRQIAKNWPPDTPIAQMVRWRQTVTANRELLDLLATAQTALRALGRRLKRR